MATTLMKTTHALTAQEMRLAAVEADGTPTACARTAAIGEPGHAFDDENRLCCVAMVCGVCVTVLYRGHVCGGVRPTVG